ncbi:peptidase S8/S53 domain-containing protein [Xylariaceae sp. FL0255]|nr:peptidase S8/S53 domain-containing protein [Xylariaceae sp. FL0255]
MFRYSLLLSVLGAALLGEARVLKGAKYVPGSYNVEFEDAYDPSGFFNHIRSTANTRTRYNSTLFKGAAIQFHDLNSAEDSALKLPDIDGVKAHENAGHSSDTFSPHVMTQVDKLRAKDIVGTNLNGTGIKIGIIDSGEMITLATTSLPYDGCAGHGTHVSGIIAAQPNQYGFTGAAPGVSLGMYRVFGCEGKVGDDVLIDAYLQAYEDGSKIITASIGDSSGWSEDPWAVVVSRIVDSGVPCTLAAGNDGNMGLFYASTAADGLRVSSIASVDNWVTPMLLTNSSFSVNGSAEQTFGYAVGDPASWANVTLPLWTPSFTVSDPAMGCDAYPDDTPNLSGYIVLIRRGTCTFVQKVENAVDFGAQYVMFYNGVAAGAEGPEVGEIQGVGMVTADQGVSWVSALEAGSKIVLDMLDPNTTAVYDLSTAENNVTGGYASTNTTWNPTFEMDVKPQISSPGGDILSIWPQDLGSYAVISAIYALIANVRGAFDPTTLESVIASTAKPQLLNDGTATYDLLSPVVQMGAGFVQAYDAAYATTLLGRSYLVYNDTDNFVDTLNFTLTNLGTDDVTYSLGSVGAATAYTFSDSVYPDPFPGPETSDDYATVKLSDSKITIAGGDNVTISVTVTTPALDGSRLPVYSGYITLNGTNGENFSLPYNGAVGSLHSIQVLDTAYLAKSSDPNLNSIDTGNITFVLSKEANATFSAPVAIAMMAFGSPLISYKLLQVTGANSTGSLGDILGSPSAFASPDEIPLEFTGQLANGSYAPADPDHREITSQVKAMIRSAPNMLLRGLVARRLTVTVRPVTAQANLLRSHTLFARTAPSNSASIFSSRLPYSTSTTSSEPEKPEKPTYLNPAESQIWETLIQEFEPTQLLVQDISGGCGSMYAIEITSEKFRGIGMLKQQRMVNQVLSDDLKNWHGIQLRTKVPTESKS